MKFKELKERIGKMSGSKLTGQELSVYYRENPLAKKAARDPMIKKAIEFALDHGGAMNYAIKNIEKMKRGISRHPQVQQALQFANESNNIEALRDYINEKMSPADKKKRLDMIRKAVEKLNARADAQAKKDALAAIKAMESVNEARITITTPMYNELEKMGLSKLMKKHDAYLNKDETDSKHTTISTPSGRFHGEVQNLIKKNMDKIMKVMKDDVNEGKYSAYSDLLVMKARIIDKEGPKSNKLPAVDDAIRIAKKKLGIKEDSVMSVRKQNMFKVKPMLKFYASKHPKVKVEYEKDGINIKFVGKDKDIEALFRDIEKNKTLVRLMDSVQEGLDKKEKVLNYKMKELEYKMKLKDFMDNVVKNKLPQKNEYGNMNKKKKMAEADTVELKVSDTSSSTFNKLKTIAKDIGVDINREENHLKITGDSKKMEEFKAQMSVAMKESVQLQEGTWQVPDSYPKLVALQRFLRKPHKAKNAKEVFAFHNEVDKFFGDDSFSDKLDSYYDMMPGGDVDPYDGKKKSPAEYKETLKRLEDYYKRNPQDRIKKGSDLNFVLTKALTDWTGGILKFKGNKIVQMPRDWYMNDNPEFTHPAHTPIKATLNADVDVDDDAVKEVKFKRKSGNLKMKRQQSIQVESTKKTFNEVRMVKRRDVMRKHGAELNNALRSGSLDLSPKAEDDLIQYVMDNYPEEIRDPDEPDDWIEWLDDNLEDFVKGKGYK
tara:strand:+ start:16 stop:2163 length:2148 start_codon:yes stop_codon:yes gene_type:complete